MRADAALESLINTLARLPGFGARSARRAVLHLLADKENRLSPLIDLLQSAAARIIACERCGNLDITTVCQLCQSPQRATGVLCVVTTVSDLWAAERAGAFLGRYHVLGGILSAANGVTPAMLRIETLLQRLASENITEVILAFSVTPEAQTTSYYLSDLIKQQAPHVRISVPARGMSVGSTPEYTDEGTLYAAFATRQTLV